MGKLGDQNIGLQIDEFGKSCFMRCFNRTNHTEKLLHGDILDDNSFIIYAYKEGMVYNKEMVTETVRMKEVDNFEWSGTWEMEDGKTYEVHFTPIVVSELDHPHKEDLEKFPQLMLTPMCAYRTLDTRFEAIEKVKQKKQIQVQWVVDPVSGIKHFRLVADKKGHYNVDEMNSYLLAEHLKLIDAYKACTGIDTSSTFKVDVNLNYYDQNYLSYSMDTESGCIGAPVRTYTENYNFSTTSGQKIMLEDLYWFSDEEKPDLKPGGPQWYTYRNNIFGAKILEIMHTTKPELFNNMDEKCKVNDPKYWRYANWYLTTDGVCILGNALYKNTACNLPEGWSIIPWKAIEKYYVGK